MDAMTLVGPTKFSHQRRTRPEPGEGEVLIAISQVGICGSDLHWYKHGQMGDRVVDDPLVLGHESAGRIEAIGSGVSDFTTGDRVTIEPGIPCGTCQACRSGEYNLCLDVEFMSTPGTDGALVEYVVWPAEFVHPLPSDVTMTEGALCEPLSVGLFAIRRGGVGVGDTVLITGAGPIGRAAMECAQVAGATEIVVVDIVDKKLKKATDRGADIAINSRTQDVIETLTSHIPDGVDVAVEATGVPAAIQTLPDLVCRGGTIVLIGLASEEAIPFDTCRLVRNQIDIRGSYRFANTYSTVIELLANNEVDVESMVDFHEPLAKVPEAFERATEPEVIKGVIDIIK